MKTRSRLSILLFAILLTVSWAPGQTRITPEMLVDLQQVGAVALSPDARRVAYVVSVPRSENDPPGSSFNVLKVISTAAGAEARQFTGTPGSVSTVDWTPSGDGLTFLSRRNGDKATQLYRIALGGGEAFRVFEHPSAILDYAWSPDGSRIAFTAIDAESEERTQAKKEGRDWKVVNQEPRFRHLWIYDLASGTGTKIVADRHQVWSFLWGPDGTRLFLQITDMPLVDDSFMSRRIVSVPSQGGELSLVCETAGKLGPMRVSPDGRNLAFLGAERLNDSLAQNVWLASLADGSTRNLTEGAEFSAVQLDWLDDSQIMVLAQKGTGTSLMRLTKAGDVAQQIDPGVIVSSFDVAPRTGSFVALGSTPNYPTEVHIGRLEDLQATRLTWHNPALDSVKLAPQKVVEWRGPDNLRIEGILTYPLGYVSGRRYPLVLQVHGGPEGIDLNGWKSRALYPVQLLAAEGYFVLQPNYRGSGGRGTAFSTADHDDLGGEEYDDVLAGIDFLIEQGLVDENRVATGGFSYGGYFSAWAATRHSNRFKAAVVGAGITNWVSFTGTSDIPYENSIVHWNQWWFDNPALHWQRSPLSHINRAQTPTLIVHGENDTRVPPTQSVELFTALRIKKVPVELVLYPREPHGIGERAHQLDYIGRVLSWFDQYIGEAGSTPVSQPER